MLPSSRRWGAQRKHGLNVVKLKNAMTRTWKPDGSNTTFNVANLFDVLEKLTMQQLLLSYQPAS